ncbi:MAG: SemiSWEET family transporter [Bacteroidota bacterium]
MSNLENIIGISASIFTAVASIPQLLKLIKVKKADDISSTMLLVLLFGLGLWIYYGFLKEDWILIIANSFSVLVNLSVLLLALDLKNK